MPLNPKRVDVGFFYKEIEGTGDYFDADALGSGWVKALQVTDKDSCYSTMLLMDDGQVGFLYEESLKDDGYDIIFKSLSIEEITLGRYALRPGFLR